MEDTILETFNRIFDAQFEKNGEYWIHSPCSYMTVKFRVFSTSFRTEFEFKGCRNYEFKDNLFHHEDNPSEVYVDGDYGRLVPVDDRIVSHTEDFRSGALYDLEEQVGIALDVTKNAIERA